MPQGEEFCETGPAIARIILYVKDIPRVAAFYERFFSMKRLPGAMDAWLELASPSGGCTIALHQAAKSQKSGASMKLVFAVADVPAFIRAKEREGLTFGPIHRPEGFAYSNTKDPAGKFDQCLQPWTLKRRSYEVMYRRNDKSWSSAILCLTWRAKCKHTALTYASVSSEDLNARRRDATGRGQSIG